MRLSPGSASWRPTWPRPSRWTPSTPPRRRRCCSTGSAATPPTWSSPSPPWPRSRRPPRSPAAGCPTRGRRGRRCSSRCHRSASRWARARGRTRRPPRCSRAACCWRCAHATRRRRRAGSGRPPAWRWRRGSGSPTRSRPCRRCWRSCRGPRGGAGGCSRCSSSRSPAPRRWRSPRPTRPSRAEPPKGTASSAIGRVVVDVLRWAPLLALAFLGAYLLLRSRRERVSRAIPARRDAEVAAALAGLMLLTLWTVAAFGSLGPGAGVPLGGRLRRLGDAARAARRDDPRAGRARPDGVDDRRPGGRGRRRLAR